MAEATKVDMPKKKNKYLADKVGEYSNSAFPNDDEGANTKGTFGKLWKNLKNKE